MKNMMKKTSFLFALVLLVTIVACTPASTPTAQIPTNAPVVEPSTAPVSAAVATEVPAAVATEASAAVPTEAAEQPEAASESGSADGVERISIDDLKALIDSGKNVLILDARPRESYQMGHIKGAMSLPWKVQLSSMDTEDLPSGMPIVTYCDCGPGEADGSDVARQLIELGYKDVKVLADPSVNGWIDKGYPTE